MAFVYNVTGRIFTYAIDQFTESQQCKLDLVVTNVQMFQMHYLQLRQDFNVHIITFFYRRLF